jgi:hypothetical protein
MRKIKASGKNPTNRGDKSELSAIIPSNILPKNCIRSVNTSISLKQQYDQLINQVFQ